jgi:hypothetical protein
MQTFNFFLVVVGFLVAAYASLLEKRRAGAVAVSLLGAWLSFWFNRIDYRTRQLVKASELRSSCVRRDWLNHPA